METFKLQIVSVVYICAMNLKDTLIAESLHLFLKYGIKSISMDDICKRLCISKKTIYQLIANKDELVSAVLEKHLEEDEKEIEAITSQSSDAIEEMVFITRYILDFLGQMKPAFLYDLQKYHHASWHLISQKHFSFIEKTIYNNLIRGQKEGIYRKDFNPVVISKLYVKKSNCMADEDVFPFDQFTRTQLFKEAITYHLNGVVTEEGRQLLSKHKKIMSS